MTARECAVAHCGQDDSLLLCVCPWGHWMHDACVRALVDAARGALDDGITTSHLKCPLCRDETVLSAWKEIFGGQDEKENSEEEEMMPFIPLDQHTLAMRRTVEDLFDVD
jgi:hypothetical protein